ncbi:PIN domain-containing protein [Halobellus ordinarius]|uniref:PIN domain-containing protein n=1 Tax=Halobellus ordinarius TaxID=3075120 RepID=UPI00288040CC|nr:PIN domain-containing protein [Halobellus sp. ZY16]
MILDTQFLGALVDGSDGARAKAAEIDDRRVPTRVPTAVVWEAYTGIGNAASAETARQLRGLYERLLANHSTVALTPDVSQRAGELNGTHLKSDTLTDLDGADSIVAAHGLLLDEPVVSNDGDFQDIDGLEVVTY